MNNPNLVFFQAGFDKTTKTISSDGVLSINISSNGSSTSRLSVSLDASTLGLVNGKTYTVKVWSVENNFSSTRASQIYTNNSYRNYLGNSPYSKTWTQNDDYGVQVGLLYWNDYSAGALCSFKIMLAEGENIEEWFPFTGV